MAGCEEKSLIFFVKPLDLKVSVLYTVIMSEGERR